MMDYYASQLTQHLVRPHQSTPHNDPIYGEPLRQMIEWYGAEGLRQHHVWLYVSYAGIQIATLNIVSVKQILH